MKLSSTEGTALAEEVKTGGAVSEEERIWGLIAWLLSVVGAVITLALKPTYRYARYWAYLSIAFFIAVIVSGVVATIVGLIPLIGWFISLLISIALLVIYIIGIIKSLAPEFWRPPIIYDVARMLGIEKLK